MNEMNIIEALKTDGEFLARLAKAETKAEICKMFEEKGIVITEEEVQAIFVGSENQELSEDDLDNVAGGMSVIGGVMALMFLAGLAKGAKCK